MLQRALAGPLDHRAVGDGSLKGTPSSITSAPASIAARTMSRVVARSGSPQVM